MPLFTEITLPDSIQEAGRLFRGGSLTVEALTQAYLGCIAELQPKLNAFITITPEEALKSAQRLDAELKAGRDRGPLHGIPIVYKDNVDTSGTQTTMGSEFFRHRVPNNDATLVRKLKGAGVVMLGKTNMNELAAGPSGTNVAFGDTHNPWNLSRSPGGTSSGTGAAVAARLCLAGTGTDTGGSIRIPACWSGVVGIRPTFGRVSTSGVFPRAYSLDCPGPLARSVADAATLLNAMVGYDATDKYSIDGPNEDLVSGIEKRINDLSLAVVEDYEAGEVDADVDDAFHIAIDTLAKCGATVKRATVPLFRGALDYRLIFDILLYEFNKIIGDRYREAPNRHEVFGPIVQRDISLGERIARHRYEQSLAERQVHLESIRKVLGEFDAFLTPTMPMAAPPLTASMEEFDRARQFALPISYLGLPAISVPCGFNTDGLPIGLQIIGDKLQEKLLIRIAAAYERSTEFNRYTPPTCCSRRNTSRA
jgi:aspartyl-tRNA(Asn)/glutamyl-tRNA(Gln) amidotransferase subunit A